jgi:hypothetical protein
MWLDRFEKTHSDLVIMKMEEFREKTLKEIADVSWLTGMKFMQNLTPMMTGNSWAVSGLWNPGGNFIHTIFN